MRTRNELNKFRTARGRDVSATDMTPVPVTVHLPRAVVAFLDVLSTTTLLRGTSRERQIEDVVGGHVTAAARALEEEFLRRDGLRSLRERAVAARQHSRRPSGPRRTPRGADVS